MQNSIKHLLVFSLTFCLGAGLGKFGRSECTPVAAINQPAPGVNQPVSTHIPDLLTGVRDPVVNYPFAVKRSEAFIRKRAIENPLPIYLHYGSYFAGTVSAQVLISESGKVIKIWFTQKNHPLLETSTYRAVQKWKFRPLVINGQKVWVQSKLTFRFTC